MNKYCVIARNVKTYFIKRLSEEVGESLVYFNPWSQDILPSASVYLFRSSAVYGDDQDLKSLASVPSSAKIINPPASLSSFRDKLHQYSRSLGQPFQSIPWINLQGAHLAEAEKFIQLHGDVVVKPHRGQQGWGVEKLDRHRLQAWWERRSDDEYLLQKFISGEEYRLFFIKDSFFLLRRSGDGGVANFALGGEAELALIPPQLREMGRVCIKNSGALYGAIDLIYSKGEYHFLELNLSPGIEQLEKVTGENIIRLLLDSMKSAT